MISISQSQKVAEPPPSTKGCLGGRGPRVLIVIPPVALKKTNIRATFPFLKMQVFYTDEDGIKKIENVSKML